VDRDPVLYLYVYNNHRWRTYRNIWLIPSFWAEQVVFCGKSLQKRITTRSTFSNETSYIRNVLRDSPAWSSWRQNLLLKNRFKKRWPVLEMQS